jgi:hypothetical protein
MIHNSTLTRENMIRTIAPPYGIVHFNRDSRVFRFNMKSIRIAAAAKAALKDNSV